MYKRTCFTVIIYDILICMFFVLFCFVFVFALHLDLYTEDELVFESIVEKITQHLFNFVVSYFVCLPAFFEGDPQDLKLHQCSPWILVSAVAPIGPR